MALFDLLHNEEKLDVLSFNDLIKTCLNQIKFIQDSLRLMRMAYSYYQPKASDLKPKKQRH
jgi:hypothetical protein